MDIQDRCKTKKEGEVGQFEQLTTVKIKDKIEGEGGDLLEQKREITLAMDKFRREIWSMEGNKTRWEVHNQVKMGGGREK